MIRFSRRDFVFIAVCVLIFAAGLAIGIRYFGSAFPEASIDFKVDRGASRDLAERFLAQRGLTSDGMRHSAQFEHDSTARIFLERTIGLEKANALMGSSVHVWYWRHRWFVPLERQEFRVDVAPTGEIVSFAHVLAEEAAAPEVPEAAARAAAEAFLQSIDVAVPTLRFVGSSERRLPKRLERTFTWEVSGVSPGGAPYRHHVTLRGAVIASYEQALRVPDAWKRDYADLRSKNFAAGAVDQIFMAITMIAALIVFILRLRRGDLQVRFTLWAAAIGAVLVAASTLNAFPSALANYDTRESFAAFVTSTVGFSLLEGLTLGLLLMVIVGAGEALYRERYPRLLAVPRLASFRALRSRRVFLGFVLGYTLFGAFLAYQVAFYIVATKFGAWSPADIPYDSILNTAFPWMAVLFMGFFPAVSEEFLSRAFSIPFFSRLLRSPLAAIVLSGFVWGFGHAAYPNQPFFIRGIEVGVAGVVIGFLMLRYGLLPLLVWHYTVDALYTSFLLFRSGNAYYVFSAALASLVFAIPMIVSLILYFRHGGFEPDDALSNAAMGTIVEPPQSATAEALPEAVHVTARPFPPVRAAIAAAAVVLAVALAIYLSRKTTVVNYAIGKQEATALARTAIAGRPEIRLPEEHVAYPSEGFRSWSGESRTEEGGSPGGYSGIAIEYLLRHGVTPAEVARLQRESIEAATWVTRFFTPRQKEEVFVEIDPRTRRSVGFHRYLEESAPGATLERAPAELLAAAEFARHGLDSNAFEVREALVFQQPARRDWLFHFQERRAIAGEAYRRVSVRVAGDRVTQFAKSVKIPEHEVREATKRTFLGTILLIAKIVGGLTLFSLVILGSIYAFRSGGFRWRAAARWTAALAPLTLLAMASGYDRYLRNYDTSIAWSTFVVTAVVGASFVAAAQLGGTFLSLTAIESGFPQARHLLSRAGRAATGRAAAVLGVGAAAIVFVNAGFSELLAQWFPKISSVRGLTIPPEVADSLPIAGTLADAILMTLLGCATAATIGTLVREATEHRKIWHALTIVSIFVLALDGGATAAQLPIAIVRALTATAVVWAIPALFLRDHLLAYPVALLTLTLAGTGFDLLANDRTELQVHGGIAIAAAAAFVIWIAWPAAGPDGERSAEGSGS